MSSRGLIAPVLLVALVLASPPLEGGPDVGPSLCVRLQPACHVVGSVVSATVALGASDSLIVGAQVLLQYDPTHLLLLDVAPGSTCDPASPFAQELFADVDQISGSIVYSVGVPLGGTGTNGPATMICLRFQLLESSDTDVCLNSSLAASFLVDDSGQAVMIDNSADCPAASGDPLLSCETVVPAMSCACAEGTADCSVFDSACAVGVCDESMLTCRGEAANEGGDCDDGNDCTTIDSCIDGECVGSGCTDPSLCVIATVSCESVAPIAVQIQMGSGEPVIFGGQFVLSYDPSAMDFIDIVPGQEWDSDSPFAMELAQQVDPESGEIFYAVGVDFVGGDPGTTGPAILACAFFAPRDGVDSDVCILAGVNPSGTILVDQTGQAVSVNNTEDCPVGSGLPFISCDHVIVDEDCLCQVGSQDCSALDTDCRVGVCNKQTGQCEVQTVNGGGPCDDGNSCTANDQCFFGQCLGFMCPDPSLCLDTGGCVGPGLENTIRIRIGEGDRVITGGQFSIQYDPELFSFVDISPGASCDQSSPFPLEIFESVDATVGEIFYAVGVVPGQTSGTTGPATLACLTLISLQSNPGDICIFDGLNPFLTMLVDEFGQIVGVDNTFDCATEEPDPIVSCDEVCTIPTISTWGVTVLILLLATAGKLCAHRFRDGWPAVR